MYRNFKTNMPQTLYRNTSEIRSDIMHSQEELSLILEKLNPRALLLEIINDERCNNPKKLLLSLEDALARAEDAYRNLSNLKHELCELEEELEETLCEMRC